MPKMANAASRRGFKRQTHSEELYPVVFLFHLYDMITLTPALINYGVPSWGILVSCRQAEPTRVPQAWPLYDMGLTLA